jgi:hypothetical protein
LGGETLDNRNEFDSTARWGNNDQAELDETPGIIPELNPAQLFNWNMAPDAAGQLGGLLRDGPTLPRAVGESPIQPFSGQSGGGASPGLREYERAWDFRKSPLGARFGDPIHDQPDATRAIMNPIAARKASVPPPESSQPRPGDPFGSVNAAPVSTRPDFMTAGRERMSTPAFSPPPAAPVRTPIVQAKPGVLEIPRPKF